MVECTYDIANKTSNHLVGLVNITKGHKMPFVVVVNVSEQSPRLDDFTNSRNNFNLFIVLRIFSQRFNRFFNCQAAAI